MALQHKRAQRGSFALCSESRVYYTMESWYGRSSVFVLRRHLQSALRTRSNSNPTLSTLGSALDVVCSCCSLSETCVGHSTPNSAAQSHGKRAPISKEEKIKRAAKLKLYFHLSVMDKVRISRPFF